jgi:hypothetical protein
MKRPSWGESLLFFFFCSTRVWTQGLHLEPYSRALLAFFAVGFFRDRVSHTTCPGWLQTTTLLTSWVARITGMSHQTCCNFFFLIHHNAQKSCWDGTKRSWNLPDSPHFPTFVFCPSFPGYICLFLVVDSLLRWCVHFSWVLECAFRGNRHTSATLSFWYKFGVWHPIQIQLLPPAPLMACMAQPTPVAGCHRCHLQALFLLRLCLRSRS